MTSGATYRFALAHMGDLLVQLAPVWRMRRRILSPLSSLTSTQPKPTPSAPSRPSAPSIWEISRAPRSSRLPSLFEKDFGTGPTVGVIAVTVGEHYGLESMARAAGMERAFQRFPFWALTYSADGSWGIVGTSYPVEYEDFDKRAIPAHPRPLFTPSADLGEL